MMNVDSVMLWTVFLVLLVSHCTDSYLEYFKSCHFQLERLVYFFDKKIQIFFIFLLKTKIVGTR